MTIHFTFFVPGENLSSDIKKEVQEVEAGAGDPSGV